MNKIFEIILRKLPFLKNNFLSPIFILLFFGSGFALIGALISQYNSFWGDNFIKFDCVNFKKENIDQ